MYTCLLIYLSTCVLPQGELDMALSGIQIYKMLPQTNCKECGFPTCLAFAMKLAAKQADLAKCPYVSDEAREKLAESAAPPVRLVTLSADGREIKSGNEIVLFRHEKTFFNPAGLFIRLRDDRPLGEIKAQAEEAADYMVEYVGMELTIDGFAIEATGDGDTFAAAVKGVLDTAKLPLILIATDVAVMAQGLEAAEGTRPLIYGATADNWEAFAGLAKKHDVMVATFGHAGDGDLHPTITTDERDEEEMKRVAAFRADMYKAVVDLEGTITGEHGVGITKKPYLKLQFREDEIEVMRSIKRAIDPKNILNPGKII